eukprot:362611-Chlamydomonas_euryale.AAC.1
MRACVLACMCVCVHVCVCSGSTAPCCGTGDGAPCRFARGAHSGGAGMRAAALLGVRGQKVACRRLGDCP